MTLDIPDPKALGCVVSGQKIRVHNMVVESHIGYPDWEREERQRLRLDLEMTTRVIRPLDDTIHHVVDYGPILDRIREICANSRARLLEVLADRIAATCLEAEFVESVTVSIGKLELCNDAESVGIEVTWQRNT
ncbi:MULTISPECIES: dihydroneopterin aldolase [Limibacillus]|jgi:dihydroneopterin aldolase|uniref:dihydroneopterin aldolase n=1 Tax=Limibacillus halophilus TaxID=1579333 RepID=A0A839ST41_9PROT|nr:dihydroneopterin aldolase [Limibacillus halophilus]MBB3066027.1 dihydroneopterin aldolase [Limibacillus halophilus]